MISGCVDFNVGKRPIDQSDTKWVCINPNIYFEVNEKYIEITGSNTYGKIILDGVTTEIAVDFDYGKGVTFRPVSSFHKGDGESQGYVVSDDFLFKGHCKFSKDKFVVDIFNNNNGFLDESMKRIAFIKE